MEGNLDESRGRETRYRSTDSDRSVFWDEFWSRDAATIVGLGTVGPRGDLSLGYQFLSSRVPVNSES